LHKNHSKITIYLINNELISGTVIASLSSQAYIFPRGWSIMKKLVTTLLLMATSIGASYAQGEYPIPGRLDGTTAFFHEADGPNKANKSYPSWYRGNGPDGLADKNSLYHYVDLIGPSSFVSKGHNNEHIYMGTLELAPGETYPAHSHPASEIYYVISGEAEWFVDDQSQRVLPGEMIYHRSLAAHGWRNLSKDKPLRVAWIWWAEGDTSVLAKGARFTNPDLFSSRDKVQPFAVPLPKVRRDASDNVNGKYGEYPLPGRLVGTTAYVHENATPEKATKTHPAWFRGQGDNGIADENAKYFYHELIGPNLPKPAFNNSYLYFGSLEQKSGYTYPAHNHPAPEFYFVISGEAEWYVDDERQTVKPGTIIYHRPYAVHGWKTTSKEPLRMIWAWWVEEDPTVLNVSAKMVNPDLAKEEKTALPYAKPIPPVRAK
jgi:quercetin dioxygenase-like cupin family protein